MIATTSILDELMPTIKGLAGQSDLGFTATHVTQAMQAAYFASIRREEGEKVLPHLALLSDETLHRLEKQASILHFENPTTLTPEALRKRCLAFRRSTSCFLAVPSETGLAIRGVANVGWAADQDNLRPTHVPLLRFDCEDAGTVVVAFERTRLGILRDGSFFSSRGSIFTNVGFKRSLTSTFQRLSTSVDRTLAFIASLSHVIRTAMSYGLGGTIVVVDEFRPLEFSECFEAGEVVRLELRKNDHGQTPAGVVRDVLDTEAAQTHPDQLSQARRAHLEFVARLACVDGALILGPTLQPIRFATKLRAPPSEEPVFLGGDLNHQSPSILQGVGTRHSSALNFVSHVKRAIAFTISSDGPVSAFSWLDGRLSWWKNAVEL